MPAASTGAALIHDDLLLAAVMGAPSLAVVSADVDGTVTRWSAGAAALFGWAEYEVVGQSLACLLQGTPGDISAHVSGLVAGPPVAPFEARRRTKGGALVDVEVHIMALRGPDGPVGLLALYRQLHRDRRSPATDLLPGQRTSGAALRGSPVPQASIDVAGNVLAANTALADLLRADRAELTGRRVLELPAAGQQQLQPASPRAAPARCSASTRSSGRAASGCACA